MSKRIEGIKIFHDAAGDTMSWIAPVLAPVLSAMAVFYGLSSAWNIAAGIVGAMVIEGLGFAAVRQVLRTAGSKRRGLWYASVSLSVLYLVATYAILITTFTHSFELTLPMLTLLGAGLYGISSELDREDHADEDEAERMRAQRIAEAQAAAQVKVIEAEAKAKAKMLSVGVSGQVPGQVSQESSHVSQYNGSTSGGTLPRDKRWDKILDIWRDDPYMSPRDVAGIIGVGKSTVYRDKKELEAAGVIHVNGNGVEVLR